jgi:hypothetical protein
MLRQKKQLSTVSPLEKVIVLALKRQGCTATELAKLIGMAPTNLSLARNSKRSFPLPALLNLMNLAGVDAEEKIKTLEWISFNQILK